MEQTEKPLQVQTQKQ